jgi:16S rRNA (cytosine1402-N4)-methyltransferase
VRNKYAQIYQAIRIEVNQEMDVLKNFLNNHWKFKKDRLGVISYHSLEDRLVKRFIKMLKKPERDFFGNFSVPFKSMGNDYS